MSERAPRGKFNWGIERVFEHFYFAHMEEVRLEYEPRVLMLLMDARPIAQDRLQRFAARLMEQGVIFFVCWGPGCKRMHDSADRARGAELIEGYRTGQYNEDDRRPVIMTTYHYVHEEEVEQTAEFWCRFCYPSAAWGQVRTWTSIVIGNEEWHERLVRHIETRPLSRLERGLPPEAPGEESE